MIRILPLLLCAFLLLAVIPPAWAVAPGAEISYEGGPDCGPAAFRAAMKRPPRVIPPKEYMGTIEIMDWSFKGILRERARRDFDEWRIGFLDVNGDRHCDLLYMPEEGDGSYYLFMSGPDGHLPSRPINAFPIDGHPGGSSGNAIGWEFVPIYVKGDPIPYIQLKDDGPLMRWNPSLVETIPSERRPEDPKGGFEQFVSCFRSTPCNDFAEWEKDAPESRRVYRFISDWYIREGRKELDAHRYIGASVDFTRAIRYDPANAYAYYFMGMAEYLAGEFACSDPPGYPEEGACYYFERALERGILEKPQAHYNLGLSYEALKDIPKARAAYQKYLRLAPNGVRAPEIKIRLSNFEKGITIKPVMSKKMLEEVALIDRLTGTVKQALPQVENPAPAPKLQPGEVPAREIDLKQLKALDAHIIDEAKRQGKTIPEAERDWMVAYKAKFPQTDLADLVKNPGKYKQLPWVREWLKTYRGLK